MLTIKFVLVIAIIALLLSICCVVNIIKSAPFAPEMGIEYDSDNIFRLEKAHEGDACYDVFLPQRYCLHSGRQVIDAGFKLKVPEGYSAIICPRSGNDSKGMPVVITHADGKSEDVRISIDVKHGIIDSCYRGKVGVIINNHHRCKKNESAYIKRGHAIAQILIVKAEEPIITEQLITSDTDRGTEGYGSSDSINK